jgi:hypothetical protein
MADETPPTPAIAPTRLSQISIWDQEGNELKVFPIDAKELCRPGPDGEVLYSTTPPKWIEAAKAAASAGDDDDDDEPPTKRKGARR